MKTNILSLLALAGLISFAGCASDDTANKQSEQELGTEGLTSFVEEAPATRTTSEYDGSGLNFYWTEGDRLWVNAGTSTSPVLKQDSKNNINNLLVANPAIPTGVKRVAKARFWFSGTYTASSYPVRYTGKNGTADKVTIKASQSQTIPNDASHIGEDGDCGVATATKPTGDTQYHFTLEHKAAYITFMPYTTQSWGPNAVVQKIRVYTNNTSDALAGTFDLADDGTLSNAASTSNSVELAINNFSIPNAFSYTANGATMVVNPGTYSNVSIEYTFYDPATTVVGTITKTYASVTFTAGKNKKVKTNLQVKEYPGDGFYQWDAAEGQQYWKGHEWDKPDYTAGVDQPTLYGPTGSAYPRDNTDPRWYNPTTTEEATRSCKDCPNVNECMWYAMQGDPHWDDELWTTMGHLYRGGMWFLKKANISGFTNTDYNGTDYHTTRPLVTNHSVTQGKPSNLNDYFYLPALGSYKNGMWIMGGISGSYWSGTPEPWGSDTAYNLRFYSGYVYVGDYDSYYGYQLWTAQ